MLAGCSVIIVASCVITILRDWKGTWLEALVLLPIGLVAGIIAFRTYKLARNKKRGYKDLAEILETHKAQNPLSKPKVEILVNWMYSISEWKEFLKWEKKQGNSTTLIEASSLVIMATLAIHYSENVDWLISILISLILGFVYSITKYCVNLFSINLEENKIPEVIITNEAVIINGLSKHFLGQRLILGKISVNDTGEFNLLEITFGWQTKNGNCFDEIRVPIPKGSLKEAIFLQERLSNKGVLH